MYDDTVIVFSSDHGELMGDYRSMGKRTMLEAAANIPFLLKMPGQAPGMRHDPASLVDLAPTRLSACGIPYDPDEYDGVDLMHSHHEEVYSQYSNGTNGIYMIANGRDKLIYSAIGDRYFYFDSFPDATDRFHDPAVQARIAELRPKLDAYIASDRSPIVEKRPFVSPARQAYGSFYQPLDDHILTMQQEAARMPEGYPITLKAKVKDF